MTGALSGRVILASRSPRRVEALTALGVEFTAEASSVEDQMATPADPTDPVPIAVAKAEDIARRHPGEVVLAGDTIVVLAQEALGKPVDKAEAEAMLRRLRGKRHVVRTGLALASGGTIARGEVACPLRMRDYADEEMRAYAASGEPLDCAGAYDVHKFGGALVASVDGCFSAVVGFPIVAAAGMLRGAGVDVTADPAQTCTVLYGRPCLALREETAGECRLRTLS